MRRRLRNFTIRIFITKKILLKNNIKLNYLKNKTQIFRLIFLFLSKTFIKHLFLNIFSEIDLFKFKNILFKKAEKVYFYIFFRLFLELLTLFDLNEEIYYRYDKRRFR